MLRATPRRRSWPSVETQDPTPFGRFTSALLRVTGQRSAIKQAEALLDGHDVELWQLDRHIAKFEYKPKSKA
jgi:hypothetical protein